jgi:hypothetical protein
MREDYVECLHHIKETARARKIASVRQAQTTADKAVYDAVKNPLSQQGSK